METENLRLKQDINEIISLTDEYLNKVSELYGKEPKQYISKIGIYRAN